MLLKYVDVIIGGANEGVSSLPFTNFFIEGVFLVNILSFKRVLKEKLKEARASNR